MVTERLAGPGPGGTDDPAGDGAAPCVVRLMVERDLPAIVNIERRRTGRPGEAFLDAKLTACLREPRLNTSLVAESDGTPVGFLLGRLFFGEFGVPMTRAVLDWMAVHPDHGGRGIAHALFEQYEKNVGALGVEAIDTLVGWERFDLLRFFRSVGFRPSRSVDLVWELARHPLRPAEPDVTVREARNADLEAVTAIDRQATGTSRRAYLEGRQESAAGHPERGAFLVAEREGRVVGFIAGGLYQGEFGIDDLRVAIDSVGVDPAERHRHAGSALVGGLLERFAGRGVRHMETLCRWNDWALLRFFEHLGFRPGARLNLERRLGDGAA